MVSVCCRGVTDKSKEGAIKDAGDTFSKKGEADEAAYFHKQNIEQLKTSFPYFRVKLSFVCLMIAYRKKLPKVTQR